MMRGPKKQAVVVRKPDGQLETQVKDLRFIKDRYPVLGLPSSGASSTLPTPCITASPP